MVKKVLLIVVIIVICLVIIAIISDKIKIFDIIDHSPISDNSSIEKIVVKAIKIQYRGGSEGELNSVFNPDFISQIKDNPHFFKKKILYTYNKDFMNSLREINNNQITVSVKTEDLSGSYIQVITLTKVTNDGYLISNIQFDI